MTSLAVEHIPQDKMTMFEERMRPRQWSFAGFLSETESLVEVAAADRTFLQNAGYSFEKIAACLSSLIDRSKMLSCSSDHCPLVGGRFLVVEHQTKGFQECPFSTEPEDCARHVGSADYTVIRMADHSHFRFGSLLPHLIAIHHFFEGGPYRVDPHETIEFFQIQPEGEDFPEPDRKLKVHWKPLCEKVTLLPWEPDLSRVTYDQIADRLNAMMFKANRFDIFLLHGEKYLPLIEGRYLVENGQPIDDHCTECGANLKMIKCTVTDMGTDRKFTFHSQGHMLREHRKFHPVYPIDFSEVVQFFEIQPNVNYKCSVETIKCWAHSRTYFGSCKAKKEDDKYARSVNALEIDIAEDVKGFVISGTEAANTPYHRHPLGALKAGSTYLYISAKNNDEKDFRFKPVNIAGHLFNGLVMPGPDLYQAVEKRLAVIDPALDKLVQIVPVVFDDAQQPVRLPD